MTDADNRGTLIHGRLKRETTPQLISSTLATYSIFCMWIFLPNLPGVWKLILRSSTGSVGWWEDIALLQGKLPFLPSASALFLEEQT